MKHVVVAGSILLLLAAGCNPYSSLPSIRCEKLPLAMRQVPTDATPVHAWAARYPEVFTYWGKQSVTVSATAYFPPNWEKPGDEFWRIDAQNGEGKPLPFIGVLHRYANTNGTRLAKVAPPVEMRKLPDGLYTVIDPNVTREEGRITCIEPVAFIVEIRDGSFKPFQFRLPLSPEVPSDLTPAPPPIPEVPEGTPIPVGE